MSQTTDLRRETATPPLPHGWRALTIVPAYNEAGAIARVIRDLRRHAPWSDVLVVDDGSADDTADIARRAGARVLVLPVNLGIGGAVQTGYRYAYRHGYDVAFQFDGDGQHRARWLRALAAPIAPGEADLVVGSRFLKPRGMTARGMRWVGIKMLAAAASLVLRRRITDPTSGCRAAGRRAIGLFAHEYPQDYPEPESLVLVHRQGFRLCERPVTMRRRRHGTSSIGLALGVHYMTRVLLAVFMSALKPRVRWEGTDS